MTSSTDARRKRSAAYASAKVLSEFFDHIRYVRTPDTVDSGLLQDYGFSQPSSFALQSTLKFLGVIDDAGKPMPAFRELQTGGDEFRDALRPVVEQAYAELFGRLDVSRDSKDKIISFFARNYSPATAERAARLFLDLCGEAGIETVAQPRKRNAPSGDDGSSRPKTPQSHGQVHDQRQGQVSGDDKPSAQQLSDTGPRIDIRINSQDFVNMDAEQIRATFEGLAKIFPLTGQENGEE